MEINIFGMKINLVTLVVSLLVGLIIGATTLCSCAVISIKEKEGFVGAPLDYNLGNGVPGDTWNNSNNKHTNNEKNIYASLAGNVSGPVPPPDGELFLFAGNKFSPDCCYKPQQYSSSTGCACISVDQMKFLNSRGGNNTCS